MHFSTISSLAALLVALANPVVSTIYVTSPVASTKGKGGSNLDVEWKDDGNSPKLSSDWGNVNVFLAAGSRTTQFKLQTLASNLAPTKTSGSYKIDATVGPSMSKYFIRFEGTKLGADGNPPLAFSALFSLSGMSGTFNSTVQAAVDGQTGATIGPSSSAATPASMTTISTVSANTLKPMTSGTSGAGALSGNHSNPAIPAHAANFALVSFGALAAGAGTLYL